MFLISPRIAMASAYVYTIGVGLILWSLGFYEGNAFFNWGPPITFFNHAVTTRKQFYSIHVLIFFHQLINNWVNTVVYPWIINEIQDSKARNLRYSTGTSLLLVNLFNFYSELDVMIILMGFTAQISFLLTITIANVITGTYINWKHIQSKEKTPYMLANF